MIDPVLLDSKFFALKAGFGWTASLPPAIEVGDTPAAPTSSQLVLFEDDKPLGPAHSNHEDVCWNGGGAYSHWHDSLYFSTSDGSDPRHNGREYRVAATTTPELPHFEAKQGNSVVGPLVRSSTGWDTVLQTILFINRLGIYIRPSAKILDFGCGSGQRAYHARDLGFDCYGFDVVESVDYRAAEDRQFFGFAQATAGGADYRLVNPEAYAIPFTDNAFDVIFSFSVLEHVQNLDDVMRECARVLKPNGIIVHCYPGRYQLIEPHIYVPLASFFAPDWWVRLWTRLGARNEFCCDGPWQEAAESNIRYIHNGICYLTRRKILSISQRYFTTAHVYSHKKLYLANSTWERTKELAKALFAPHPLVALGLTVTLRALVCEGKRQ